MSKFAEQQKGRGSGGPPFAEKATNDSGVQSTADALEEKQQEPEDMFPDAPEEEEDEEDGVGALNTSVEDPEAGGGLGDDDNEDFKDGENPEPKLTFKTSVPNTATAFSTQYRFY